MPQFTELTRELSAYSIADAALITMGIDPSDHRLLCAQKPGHEDYFYDHPGGSERHWEKVLVIVSAVDAEIIRVTVYHRRDNGEWDVNKTKVSKSSLIAWWNANGYSDVAEAILAASGAPVKAVTTGESTSGDMVGPVGEDNSPTHISGPDLGRCEQMIMLNWDEIKKPTGNRRPNARDVEHFLRLHPEIEECRGKKNRQNCISALRRRKLI